MDTVQDPRKVRLREFAQDFRVNQVSRRNRQGIREEVPRFVEPGDDSLGNRYTLPSARASGNHVNELGRVTQDSDHEIRPSDLPAAEPSHVVVCTDNQTCSHAPRDITRSSWKCGPELRL